MSGHYADQDQVDALKSWWKEYGIAAIIGVAFGAALIGGYRFWNYYQNTQNEKASAMYEQILDDISRGKLESAGKSAKVLINEYRMSPYLAMTSLMLAKKYIEKKDFTKAKEYLTKAVQDSSEEAMVHVARLRLARIIYAQENNAEEALNIINNVNEDGFSSQYDELRGDIYMSTGKINEAIKSYIQALSSVNISSEYRPVLQMKLDNAKSK